MTVVVGTAGHIDHGKTTLLRASPASTPTACPRSGGAGMTIDVGYAHLDLDDGTSIDFVDVPGHDRLVGNMLVGAGEIDAALLVVAADDGPRAQTLEHLALLDALGIATGIVVVTKIDAAAPERVAEVVVGRRRPAGADVARRRAGPRRVRHDRRRARRRSGAGARDVARAAVRPGRPPTLAIDRVFSVKGRGAVVTGTLRGGPLGRGDTLRLVPGDREVRVREIQVHGHAVEARRGRRSDRAEPRRRRRAADLHRGMVLTADPTVAPPTGRSSRSGPRSRTGGARTAVLHPGRPRSTRRSGGAAATPRAADGRPPASSVWPRRSPRAGRSLRPAAAPSRDPIGGVVLDVAPPRGISRRRQTAERVAPPGAAVAAPTARLDLHGALTAADGRSASPDVRALAGEAATLRSVRRGRPSWCARRGGSRRCGAA